MLKRENRKEILWLALMLLFLLGNLIYWGAKKSGFDCDEMYSYHFVCQKDYTAVNSDKMEGKFLDEWHTSSLFMDYLTIDQEEAFDFSGTYKNIIQDVHPPLYYLLLHGICSIAAFIIPGAFTKWCGIVLNLFFYIATEFVLYILGKKIFKSKFRAGFVCALYGISVGAVTTVMFLRMYMIFTFICVLFTLLNYLLFKKLWTGEKRGRNLLLTSLFAVTVLGILNHFYFLVFAFFICSLLWGSILIKRDFSYAAKYALAMGAGILTSYLIWPYMMEDIFSGYRGVEAFNKLTADTNYGSTLRSFLNIFAGELLGIGGTAFFLLLLYGIFLLIISRIWKFEKAVTAEGISWKLNRKEKRTTAAISLKIEDLYLLQIAIAVSFYLALVAKISPYEQDRYILNIYPLGMLILIYFLFGVFQRCVGKTFWSRLACGCMIAIVMSGYLSPGVNYIYPGFDEQLETAEKYAHLPAFYVTKGNNRYRVTGDSYFLARAHNLYPLKEDGIRSVSAALTRLEEQEGESYSQFFVYVDMAFENEEEILGKMEQELGAESAQKLFETEYTTAYLVE